MITSPASTGAGMLLKSNIFDYNELIIELTDLVINASCVRIAALTSKARSIKSECALQESTVFGVTTLWTSTVFGQQMNVANTFSVTSIDFVTILSSFSKPSLIQPLNEKRF
ncbi:unnamed protein product [Adineta ricciae]|uniref:Uncharacterized protein n=1 Tax=Adineta ricciae TaxID=249248 RepID=A0A815ANY9_ADIRI|nr:unnamed protein product [Adineta ricciae]CAF1260572.1 unnamed protein product [Adineta ricciae]